MTSDSSLKMGEMSTRTSSNVGKFRVTAARAESGKVSLGFRAPQFELTEPLSGKSWKLEDFEGYPALLPTPLLCAGTMFLRKTMVLMSSGVDSLSCHEQKGLAVVAISSNSISTHPQDGPDFMAQEAKAFNYPFPYLYDEGDGLPFHESNWKD
ncbi:hypothetical protein MLD38_000442 [Melastoma candidum]|uniref:Uncharacterized protein n=1 Tax=Melastoma candidum TaxID=119954 RepID=A0ACB9SC21_9MYRT|nr:hypothetical protein MLD38_000442 [Melastoma candidum]